MSYAFALRIVKCYRFLCEEKNEYVISKQLLKSGTSIGANIREALQAESRTDFVHKLRISLKESSETEYWLELLRDSGYIEVRLADSMLEDCRRITRILISIIKSTIRNNPHQN